jgi:hypothetical protein
VAFPVIAASIDEALDLKQADPEVSQGRAVDGMQQTYRLPLRLPAAEALPKMPDHF